MQQVRIARAGRGFTLVELLVVIAVVALLASLSTPAFTRFVHLNQARAASRQLESALHFTRMEAVARADTVTLCALDAPNGTACASELDGSAWSNGWMVLHVSSGSVLRTQPAPAAAVRIDGGARGSFVFASGGLLGTTSRHTLTNGTLRTYYADGGTDVIEGCLVVASPAGRIHRSEAGDAAC